MVETGCSATEGAVGEIAQSLYDAYREGLFDEEEWIACLHDNLAGKNGERQVIAEVQRRIETIITDDKHVEIDRISEESRAAIVREVAEWLLAESICKDMVRYEEHVQEGIEQGYFQPIYSIDEVVLRNDDQFFGDICQHLQDNYLVDHRDPPLGRGARVIVRELVPVDMPLPIPKRDQLEAGLMLKHPNKGLVVRIVLPSYRSIKGGGLNVSEEDGIKSVKQAMESLVALEDDQDDGEGGRSVLRDKLVSRGEDGNVFSYIPPLVILKVRLTKDSEPEYVSVAKKIPKKGEVAPSSKEFREDMVNIPGFREKVLKFVQACKNFNLIEGKFPDNLGRGNVIYTKKGNIYLVDINNICEEPDHQVLGMVVLLNRLMGKIEGMPDVDEEELKNGDEGQKKLYEERNMLEVRVNELVCEVTDYTGLSSEYVRKMAEQLFHYDEDPSVVEFLKALGVFDDLAMPMYFYNLKRLQEIELAVCDAENEVRDNNEEMVNVKKEKIKSSDFYSLLDLEDEETEERKYVMDPEKLWEMREAGDESWVIEASKAFYYFVDKWSYS